MGPVEQLAIFSVGFTVAYEHPEALHNAALNDYGSFVPVVVVPDVLCDALNQFEMLQVGVKRA